MRRVVLRIRKGVFQYCSGVSSRVIGQPLELPKILVLRRAIHDVVLGCDAFGLHDDEVRHALRAEVRLVEQDFYKARRGWRGAGGVHAKRLQ